MTIRVVPGYRQQLISHLLTELAARDERDKSQGERYQTDICDWAETHFYIPNTAEPVKLPLHQKAVLRFFFKRRPNGHFPYQNLIYCLSPETKVLRGDLKWVPVVSLLPGDPIIGFDEEAPKGRGNNRKFRLGKVTSTGVRVVPAKKITFEDKTTITASLEHPWLARQWNRDKPLTNIYWKKTSDLKIGDRLPKFLKVWDEATSYDAGYLAAALDGEGCLSKNVGSIGFGQKENAMYEYVKEILDKEDIRHTVWGRGKFFEQKPVRGISITTRNETIYVLGKYRPKRLLERMNLNGQTMISKEDRKIIGLEDCISPVVTLETSTSTYLAEGFGVHNSTIKKSGKSTTAGIVGRYFAETQSRYGEIFTIGNDLEQAKDRSYKEIVRSLELTPGYNPNKYMLPGRWSVQKTSMRCLLTGSTVKAIAVDAKGEAGGQPTLTIWTELWGAENVEAKRFWEEMTPIPTVPDSLRLVETYAGYDGESELLRNLYDVGLNGHQMTAGELAEIVCRPEVEGESYQDFINCWHETKGNPDTLIPIWTNEIASLAMYWDSGMVARRMPWQHMYVEDENSGAIRSDICQDCFRHRSEHDIGVTADQYYAAQEAMGPPQNYRRLHLNEWVGAESQFVPMEVWDNCGFVHPIPDLLDGDKTILIAAADAAVTGDCFGIVVVQRCPIDSNCVDVRALRKWDPKDSGGTIDLQEPEDFLRKVCQLYNIYQIAYDPYQMESTANRLRKDGVAWLDPFTQVGERLKADSQLYDMIISRRIHYAHQQGCPGREQCSCMMSALREHVANANAKMQKDEDSKLRIVKKAAGRKIDLIVSLSMATARCMYLRLGRGEV